MTLPILGPSEYKLASSSDGTTRDRDDGVGSGGIHKRSGRFDCERVDPHDRRLLGS